MAIKAAAALSVAVGAVMIGIYSWQMNDLVYVMKKDPLLSLLYDGSCKPSMASINGVVIEELCK